MNHLGICTCRWYGFSKWEYKYVEKQIWMLASVLKKNGLKISRAKTDFQDFIFKSKEDGNESNHNIRPKCQLSNKVKNFK